MTDSPLPAERPTEENKPLFDAAARGMGFPDWETLHKTAHPVTPLADLTLEGLVDELEIAHWAFVDAEYADDDEAPQNWNAARKGLAAARSSLIAHVNDMPLALVVDVVKRMREAGYNEALLGRFMDEARELDALRLRSNDASA
jgi:hypothetical protein